MEPLGGIDSLYLNNLRKEKAGLESLVRLNPTLDTNIFDFLLYDGWDTRSQSPIYRDLADKAWKQGGKYKDAEDAIHLALKVRRNVVPSVDRARETRCIYALMNYCGDKKISGVYDYVKNNGLWTKQCYIGPWGALNSSLKKVGFDPLKIGKYNGDCSIGGKALAEIRRYGMVPYSTRKNY